MNLAPTKYITMQYSMLGVSAFVLEAIGPNDTVSSLWERVRRDERIRTFDRYSDALTILFATKAINLESGLILKKGPQQS